MFYTSDLQDIRVHINQCNWCVVLHKQIEPSLLSMMQEDCAVKTCMWTWMFIFLCKNAGLVLNVLACPAVHLCVTLGKKARLHLIFSLTKVEYFHFYPMFVWRSPDPWIPVVSCYRNSHLDLIWCKTYDLYKSDWLYSVPNWPRWTKIPWILFGCLSLRCRTADMILPRIFGIHCLLFWDTLPGFLSVFFK